jgi:hypothetical protein
MRVILGVVLVLAGLSTIRSVWGGEASASPEPPLLALGALLIGLGVGVALRSRAAHLLAQVAAGLGILGLIWRAVALYAGPGAPRDADDALLAHGRLLGYALGAAGLALGWYLLRRARPTAGFGGVDLVPAAGLVAALVLGIVWWVGDDARLRPCRQGNDEACVALAATLLAASERAPTTPPTRAEERAARALHDHYCRTVEAGPCAMQRFALGAVEARAGRLDTAKEAFTKACELERTWCSRAAQAMVGWTPLERARLERQ